MQITRRYLLLSLIIFVAGCGDWLRTPLPFPTPAQHDLVVLTSVGPLTYNSDEEGSASGLEHDLVEAFALELGVGVKYLVVPPSQIAPQLAAGKAHLAAAWLSPTTDPRIKSTPPLGTTHDLLVQHEASLPLCLTKRNWPARPFMSWPVRDKPPQCKNLPARSAT